MIPLIDCHMHLQESALMRDLEGVMSRAHAVGVRYLVVNGSTEHDWPAVQRLAAHAFAEPPSTIRNPQWPAVLPCFGLHPWYIAGRSENWLVHLEAALGQVPSAVGEIGLDRWKEPRDEADQERVFLAQMELARKLNRPAMIHCLRAWGWFMGLLRGMPPLPGGMLVHAYGGPTELVEELAQRGAYFSFAANVTEAKRAKAREALAAVPIDRLLIETDAPDMLPPPEYRIHSLFDDSHNPVNEPANLLGTLRGVARVRGMSESSLAATVWANARRLLGGCFENLHSQF